MSYDYDVIVVGGGHAGIEACHAAAKLGCSTLLVTQSIQKIGYMSCNPSIGGLAKGHMVREIDILGGLMGLAADANCIQYKRLNSSKGPAVRGTRMQSDKARYSLFMQNALGHIPNLQLKQGEVKRLVLQGDQCEGVILDDGSIIRSKVVIITTGTFLNGVMFTGSKQSEGGRFGDPSSRHGISDQLREKGFVIGRLKTGTPPRLHKDSIRWEVLEPQLGDPDFFPFSLRSSRYPLLPQIACFISRTNSETHEIIRKNLHLSPMYCGLIEGVGPRYCPSIEDKVVRFADRESHQTFLEPEGLDTPSIYLQGISTSLPEEVQLEFLKTIPGLERVKVLRFGYAVEYDFFIPTQIYHHLETRPVRRLFLAGQVNGTSGYEEAAAQGLMAGINAARCIRNEPEFILGRDQAYIGVLIDDLVTKGTEEPYRMLTSRAEHRLVLREDNTVDRLGQLSLELGLADSILKKEIERLSEGRVRYLQRLRSLRITPTLEVQECLKRIGTTALKKDLSLEELLRRPEVNAQHLKVFLAEDEFDPQIAEAVEIEIKYKGYIERQLELIEQAKRLEEIVLPPDIDYKKIVGLSNEEREKLARVRPRSLAQAQRISGVNPSAIQCILVYLKERQSRNGDRVSSPS